MKAALVHNLPPGGGRRRLEGQILHLGIEVTEVCLSTAAPVTPRPIVVPFRPTAPRCSRTLRPPLRYLDLLALEHAWRRAAAEVRRLQPDVLIANPCQFLRAPGALMHASAPSVYFCDEPRPSVAELAPTRNPRTAGVYRRLHAFEERLDRRAVAAATLLAANSRFGAGEIARVYGRTAVVMPMGVPDVFTPSWEPAEHLLSVGTLIPDKGHEIVLQAAASARSDRPVLIVSPRPNPGAARHLQALAAELGVRLAIRVGVSDGELVDAYRRAHATLYLAREEPFGLASLEAQACGSPVVVSDAGGLPETVAQGVSGWAVPRDVASVARHLDLLDDLELRARMARAAAERGAASSWARAGQAVREILSTTVRAAA